MSIEQSQESKTFRPGIKLTKGSIVYSNNAGLRGRLDEFEYTDDMLDKMSKCVDDPIYFIENYVQIVSAQKKIFFKLRDYQIKFIELIHNNPSLMCMWGRQSGKSIVAAAYIVWKIQFNQNIKVLLLADQQDKAVEQLKRIKEIYENIPIWMQNGVRKWAEKRIILSNGSEVRASATHKKAASGYTVNLLYLDEFALVDDSIAQDFMSSVFPTVSSDPNAKIVVTSCVSDDTLVYTDRGIRTVGSFVQYDRPDGFGYEVEPYKLVGMRDELNNGILMHNDGFKETRIVESDYAELESSTEHKYFALKDNKLGIVKAHSLSVGDLLVIKYGMNLWGNNDKIYDVDNNELIICEKIAYLIGLLITDCSFYIEKLTEPEGLYVSTQCVRDKLVAHLDLMNIDYECICADKYRVSSSTLARIFVELNLFKHCDIRNRTIPYQLMGMSRVNTISLLRGIFSINNKNEPVSNVSTVLYSKNMLSQVRALLLNLGMLSKYSVETISFDDVQSNVYSLECQDSQHFDFTTKEHSTSSSSIIMTPITNITESRRNVYDFSLNDTPFDDFCHSVSYGGIIGFQTPRGKNNFYRMWEKNDRKNKNGTLTEGDFITLKIAWSDVPGRDEEWKKNEINRIGQLAFNQEYDCSFEGSVATLVSAHFIKNMKDKHMSEPVGTLDEGKLKIFSWPITKKEVEDCNYEYLITVDPAMGTGNDFTVAHVWLIRSNTDVEQVAIYRSNTVQPDQFVSKILALCKMYHSPCIIVETMEAAGGIIIGLLVHDRNYYNIINMQKDGVGFRMSHLIKIKACMLLQVYFEKSAIKIRDDVTYSEIEMYGKKNNSYGALGEHNDDTVSATLSMLYYINSPYFYGNISKQSIHDRPSIIKSDNYNNIEDPLIKEALHRMHNEDSIKNENTHTRGVFVVPDISKISFEDATNWRMSQRVSDVGSKDGVYSHLNGNMFWHNKHGY